MTVTPSARAAFPQRLWPVLAILAALAVLTGLLGMHTAPAAAADTPMVSTSVTLHHAPVATSDDAASTCAACGVPQSLELMALCCLTAVVVVALVMLRPRLVRVVRCLPRQRSLPSRRVYRSVPWCAPSLSALSVSRT